MSVDTVFSPKLPTVTVVAAGVQIIPTGTGPRGMVSYRVVNLSATAQKFGYGATAAEALANASASSPVYNIPMIASSVETFEFSSAMFFAADNATGFAFTPGQGA